MYGPRRNGETETARQDVPKDRELRTLKWTVGLYVLIFALKLVAYYYTGVLAILAEAFHTLSDVFISAFLLVATVWSNREADEEHMFGHGRAQNVAALVAATLFLSFTSFRLYEESIPRLFNPGQADHQNLTVAIGVLLVSMAIAAGPAVALLRQGTRGAAAKAQLLELANDELGLLAALIGTLFILAGEPIADALATIVVATIIAIDAIGLLRENVELLVGRSPDPEVLAELRAIACSVPGVLAIHQLRAQYVGPDMLHAGIYIMVRRDLSVEQADRIAEEVRERIHATAGLPVLHYPRGPGRTWSRRTWRGQTAASRSGSTTAGPNRSAIRRST